MNKSSNWAGVEFCESTSWIPSDLRIEHHATGWTGQLARPLEIEVQTQTVDELTVQVIPIRLQSKLPQTVGFAFPEAQDFVFQSAAAGAAPPAKKPLAASDRPAAPCKPDQPRTRIKPPADLVKLEDRLYFVLQPPLETLVSSAQLKFPVRTFPYQMEGIAFLFPRETAILADEMGLGKTMQAITTVRMLLLAGQLRNVLLVCPKPLVTNWVREFRQWAPEIPVTVIEGDATKRHWIWQQHNAPVRIANYELLMRDKALLDDPTTHFDLVVLDEAQRIKNRNSTTSQIVRALPRSRSWALTGTPIENSVEDLINIFEFSPRVICGVR